MDRRTFTPAQLAAYLQIPEETLAYWRRTGKGPRFYRAGRHPRYREDAVTAWEKEQEAGQAKTA